ncbi:MAG: hypothetical protein AAGI90_05160 [Chlamydiota bacterium]
MADSIPRSSPTQTGSSTCYQKTSHLFSQAAKSTPVQMIALSCLSMIPMYFMSEKTPFLNVCMTSGVGILVGGVVNTFHHYIQGNALKKNQ